MTFFRKRRKKIDAAVFLFVWSGPQNSFADSLFFNSNDFLLLLKLVRSCWISYRQSNSFCLKSWAMPIIHFSPMTCSTVSLMNLHLSPRCLSPRTKKVWSNAAAIFNRDPRRETSLEVNELKSCNFSPRSKKTKSERRPSHCFYGIKTHSSDQLKPGWKK